MDMAFCASLSVVPTHNASSRVSKRTSRVQTTRRAYIPARMMADDGETPAKENPSPENKEDGTASASGILKILREESEEFIPGTSSPREKLGVTVDADGKSNVWAVMPKESVDQKQQFSKPAILAAAFAFIVAALLILPKLPLTNGDQF